MQIIRKPVMAEAVQYTGEGTWAEPAPTWLTELERQGRLRHHPMFPARMQLQTDASDQSSTLIIDENDWLVMNEEGEVTILKPEEFLATYNTA